MTYIHTNTYIYTFIISTQQQDKKYLTCAIGLDFNLTINLNLRVSICMNNKSASSLANLLAAPSPAISATFSVPKQCET